MPKMISKRTYAQYDSQYANEQGNTLDRVGRQEQRIMKVRGQKGDKQCSRNGEQFLPMQEDY